MRRLLIASLLALATPALPYSAEPLPQIDLKGGEARRLPEADITLVVTEVEDQRCPANVDCYWEGMIRVEITAFLPQDEERPIVLCNMCEDGSQSVTLGGVELMLIKLDPSQETLARMARPPILTDYSVTMAYGPAMR